MARFPITVNMLDAINTRLGVSSNVIIKVDWRSPIGTRYYSNVPLTLDGINIEGRVESIDSITYQRTSNSSGTVNAVAISLDDTLQGSDSLQEIWNTVAIEATPVTIYQTINNLPEKDWLTLLRGTIESPISWSEGERKLSFTVSTYSNDFEIGFSGYVQDVLGKEVRAEVLDDSNEYPIVFGTVKWSKAVRSSTTDDSSTTDKDEASTSDYAKYVVNLWPSTQIQGVYGTRTDENSSGATLSKSGDTTTTTQTTYSTDKNANCKCQSPSKTVTTTTRKETSEVYDTKGSKRTSSEEKVTSSTTCKAKLKMSPNIFSSAVPMDITVETGNGTSTTKTNVDTLYSDFTGLNYTETTTTETESETRENNVGDGYGGLNGIGNQVWFSSYTIQNDYNKTIQTKEVTYDSVTGETTTKTTTVTEPGYSNTRLFLMDIDYNEMFRYVYLAGYTYSAANSNKTEWGTSTDVSVDVSGSWQTSTVTDTEDDSVYSDFALAAIDTYDSTRKLRRITERYSTNLNEKLGSFNCTTITFPYGLGKWNDEIYVTLVSTIPGNPALAIKWIIEHFMPDFTPDADSFELAAGNTATQASNFTISSSQSASTLIETIAYEANCILLRDGKVIKIKFLPEIPVKGPDYVTG